MIVENNIMQTEQMKELVKISNFSKAIPTTKNMVMVQSLLSNPDIKYIESVPFGSIAVKVGNEAFFLSPMHRVPADAVIQRDNQGLVLGIPMVAGG